MNAIPDEAVRDAALALAAGFADDPDPELDARRALTAAYPSLRAAIEAELREKIAGEIEGRVQEWPGARSTNSGLIVAARVARGVGTTRKDGEA